jgi:hypothetical protein
MSFKINFFDLMWLAESVIPPRPIARSACFDSFSDVHYHAMTERERKQFFEHVQKCHGFTLENEQCQHFYARFNPKNLYRVTSLINGKQTEHICYMFNEKYHVTSKRWIVNDYIKSVTRIHDNLGITL